MSIGHSYQRIHLSHLERGKSTIKETLHVHVYYLIEQVILCTIYSKKHFPSFIIYTCTRTMVRVIFLRTKSLKAVASLKIIPAFHAIRVTHFYGPLLKINSCLPYLLLTPGFVMVAVTTTYHT